MFVVPAVRVVTTPELLTVATAGFDEFQIYVKVGAPVACEVRFIVPPAQTAFAPVIAPATGNALTETEKSAETAEQFVELPSKTVYLIVADPGETGVSTPEVFIVAIVVFDDAQVYVNTAVPVAFGVSARVLPIQTAFPPVIGFARGRAFTVTV
jgi:hypothetical protein